MNDEELKPLGNFLLLFNVVLKVLTCPRSQYRFVSKIHFLSCR